MSPEAFSASEVAGLAGVEVSYVAGLVESGILAPSEHGFSGSDIRRVGIVSTLESAGLPLTSIATGIRTRALSLAFVDTPTYERFASLSDETFQTVSARTGVPHDLLVIVRQSIGGADPAPEDRIRQDELEIVPLVEFMLSKAFRPEAIERWLQVYGESLRRVAETEEDYFQSEVMDPLLERGLSAGEALSASHEWSPQLGMLADAAFQAIYRAHQARSWTRGIIKFVEDELESAGLHTRVDRPPAVCFLDLTGYTRLTEERGDFAAAELAERLARLVQRTSGRHGGRPVKWLGDGVMFYFPDPSAAVIAAIEMVDGATGSGLPPAHVGMHAGPVLFQEGDYFGRTVNLASRIAMYARPGEVLVSQEVVEAAHPTEVTFTEIGPVELKGVAGTVRLHVARRSGDPGLP